MTMGSLFQHAAVPDSPYAAELLRDRSNLSFSPEVEREYLRAHLTNSRALVRVTCVLATVLTLARGVEQIVTGFLHEGSLISLVVVLAASLLLMAVAFSPAFERLFLPVARIFVPARNMVIASCIAASAAYGQFEMFALLPVAVIGPFFFLGLDYRTALYSGVLTGASFLASAVVFALPMPMIVRSAVFLVFGLTACAVAARHVERLARTAFLEARLISRLAQHDPLTGTKNRRVFDEHLTRLWPQAIADGRKIALLLIDVDHFKAYNDCYGHQAGDQTLHQIAQSMQALVQGPQDLLARYGGEEFVAIIYDVAGMEAMDIADRLRRAVQTLDIEHRASPTSPAVTISIGVAVVEPTEGRTPQGALQSADQALYAAKVGGRNRVELMNEADYGMLVTGAFSKEARASFG